MTGQDKDEDGLLCCWRVSMRSPMRQEGKLTADPPFGLTFRLHSLASLLSHDPNNLTLLQSCVAVMFLPPSRHRNTPYVPYLSEERCNL
jgi:hypothetical protein